MTKQYVVSWVQRRSVAVWADNAEDAKKSAMQFRGYISVDHVPDEIEVKEVEAIAQGERGIAEKEE